MGKDPVWSLISVTYSPTSGPEGRGWTSPNPLDVAVDQSLPKHNLAFVNLQMPMDQVGTELVFDAVCKDTSAAASLADDLASELDLTLVFVTEKRVIPLPPDCRRGTHRAMKSPCMNISLKYTWPTLPTKA